MNILELQKGIDAARSGIIEKIQSIVQDSGPEYIDFITYQLYGGQDMYGQQLKFKYTDDVGPGKYFKTRKQALAYAKWKQKITPDPRRSFLTPNYFIKGDFHDSLKLKVDKNSVSLGRLTIESDLGFAQTNFDNAGITAFQLQRENELTLIDSVYAPQIFDYLHKIIAGQ